jgi:hypothetical protein
MTMGDVDNLTTADGVAKLATSLTGVVLDMVADALAAVTPTLRDVAGWLNVSYGTVRAYRTGARRPGPVTVRRLAAALRRQARTLGKVADRLDRQAEGGAA